MRRAVECSQDKADWADVTWDPNRPFLSIGRKLRVQPILMYRVSERRRAASWKSWGGIQTDQAASEEAERIGLVNSVCEPAELAETVDALLQKIVGNGPLAVAHCIEAVNHGLDLPFDDACLLEATLFGVGAASEEMREGTSAFLEKRKAQFRS